MYSSMVIGQLCLEKMDLFKPLTLLAAICCLAPKLFNDNDKFGRQFDISYILEQLE